MKQSLIFILSAAFAASLLQGCNKTSEPEACFTTDSDTFAIFDRIKVHNCSQYAEHFYVDFGDSTPPDNFVDYEGISNHHYYRKNGDYVISFYAFDENMTKRSVATKKIYLRTRYLKSVVINKIFWRLGWNNQPWDSVDGPDIYLAYYTDSSFDKKRITPIKYNLTEADLPLTLPCTELKTGSYRFSLLDDDSPNEPQTIFGTQDVFLGREPEFHVNYQNELDMVLKTGFKK